MKEYIFNEKDNIEKMINNGYVDFVNPTQTIRKLARYNYYVNQYNKSKNYTAIVDYMHKNYDGFSEFVYQKDIEGCIKDVDKMPWKDISSINITKSEIDVIRCLDDIRKQKIAFVLLCTAKYKDAYNANNNHKTDISMTDLYKMARVVLPQAERAMFLHFLTQDNLIEKHICAGTKNKKLLFVSENPEDETAISLQEVDFLELAYVYMDYISGHIGYDRCEKCGRLMKQSKTKPRKYCPICAEYEPVKDKTITCIDCGKTVVVLPKDSETCRCKGCREIHLRELKRLEMQRYRSKKTSV